MVQRVETAAQAAAWVEANGIEKARDGVLPGGVFSGKSKDVMAAYLRMLVAQRLAGQDDESRDLARRQTIAAEVAAVEAKRSAVAAERSARWALASVLVAIAALVVAAWPYLHLFDA
jgi:hypothetical protein